jgi:2-polyprenyl-3-methyl-5-hydroxy-6-metoxy-1,4-benzoquinol methylase
MLSTHTAPPSTRPSTPPLAVPACRLCGARLHRTLLDLGEVPLANRCIAADATDDEAYRLRAWICDGCTLVQVETVAPPETVATRNPDLSARFSTGQNQARRHADTMRRRLRLDADSLVIEVGSNDGTTLRHFHAAGIKVLGIEAAPIAAAAAALAGIPTEIGLFNTDTAMQIAVRHGCADLVIANNVLPHAPDLFDLAAGLACILRPNGVLTLLVPHLLALLQKLQFDAFRHDSYTYLSLLVLEHVLRSVGLRVFDAERLPDRGGSLLVQACHLVGPHATRPGLRAVRLSEGYGDHDRGDQNRGSQDRGDQDRGDQGRGDQGRGDQGRSNQDRRDIYAGFSERVAAAQDEIRDFLDTRRTAGRHVVAYGAETRGTILLNCCGITQTEIACVADPDPARHGRVLPGCRIPIVPVEALLADPPDDIIILPWPRAAEIALKLLPLRQVGTQLWTPIPRIARV